MFATHQLAGPAIDRWDNYLAARAGREPELADIEENEAEGASSEEVAEVQAAVEVTAPEIGWTEFSEAFRSNYVLSSFEP